MKIKILSPQWGHEHLPIGRFIDQIVAAGYDGIDTWLPDECDERKLLLSAVRKHNLVFVAHQHAASGSDFKAFKESFKKRLVECCEVDPVLINSHTGRDYFSEEQNLVLVDIATEVSDRYGIPIAHETHRGRMCYSPQSAAGLFLRRPELEITADLSHWVCVTESMLENFQDTVSEAIRRTRHVHARIGFEQGPQVSDPRAPEWSYALDLFLIWWDKIVEINKQNNRSLLTFTTEFGPPPYMPVLPYDGSPVANQFEVNCFMLKLLKDRYGLVV